MSRIRILMYTSYFPPQYSGAAYQAINLAKHLREKGHHIEFLTIRWPGLKATDTFDDFVVNRIEMGRGEKHKEFRLWWNLLKFICRRCNDFDILHSHGASYTNSVIGPLAKLVSWKSLVKGSLANNDLYGINTSLSGQIHKKFLKQVDACVAISRDLEKEFAAADIASEKIHYLPNGVDNRRFRPASTGQKEAVRKDFALPLDRQIAFYVGVFDQRKNIGWLIHEWLRNDAFGTKGLLLAVGPQSREDVDGGFLNSLRNLAEENPDKLRLMGEINEIERLYRAADVFILPSINEGLPNVVLEAMASGLPCVATPASGTRELVIDGVTGRTFEAGNTRQLREALQDVLGNQGALMGKRSREFIEKEFSIASLAIQYEKLYGKLLCR